MEQKGRSSETSAELLASTRLLLGEHLARTGKGSEAREAVRAGLASYQTLLDKTHQAAYMRRSWLRSLSSAARVYRTLNDLPAALSASREAAESAAVWHARESKEIAVLYVLGDCYVEYGRVLLRAKLPEDARRWFEKDAAIWRSFPRDNLYVARRAREAAAFSRRGQPE